jgi:hypothetical protein
MGRRRKVNATGRSNGEARHVRLYEWMMRGRAFDSLSFGAVRALIELYRLFNGENNGELFMSARELARRLHCGKSLAAELLAELHAKGFIRPKRLGAFNVKRGPATVWILTEHAHAGHLPTKDFMRWQPSESGQETACAGRQQKQNTVHAGGQTVHAGGQLKPAGLELVGNQRPTVRTGGPWKADPPESRSTLADTDSIPGGGELTERAAPARASRAYRI